MISDRAFIFLVCIPCDKTFTVGTRITLLPYGGISVSQMQLVLCSKNYVGPKGRKKHEFVQSGKEN